MKLSQRIANSDSHHRILIAVGVAMLVFAVLGTWVSLFAHIFLTWDAFALTILGLTWVKMLRANPQNARRTAKIQDSSRTAIFVFVISSACASLLGLGVLLLTAKGMDGRNLTETIVLSFSTVICSWLLVHTLFTLRYAHSYYRACTHKETLGYGLDFPDEKEPDYLDFAYFSFVIGMTSQVSDVQITSREIRRLALVHGMVSFAFNTIILALSINIISGLL